MLEESSRNVHLHITHPSLFPFPLPLLYRDLREIVVNTRLSASDSVHKADRQEHNYLPSFPLVVRKDSGSRHGMECSLFSYIDN